MSKLPVIVAAGGVNSAGRISGHHAYRRLVFDALPENKQQQTLRSLAELMQYELKNNKISNQIQTRILNHTLLRRIEPSLFDVQRMPAQKRIQLLRSQGQPLSLNILRKEIPDPLPKNWTLEPHPHNEDQVQIKINGDLNCRIEQNKLSLVQSGGQLPTGFHPEKLYPSRQHPRGLALAVYAASDALGDCGIQWSEIKAHVAPNEIGVYAGSAMGQLDTNGSGGMLKALQEGQRTSAKQLPLGLAEMPADFVNAYVLGNVGATGCNIGACATFLYNLELGLNDIRQGKRRVVLIGNTEAPLVPEVIEGYRVMGALAQDEELRILDDAETVDYRRACRPFGQNCGFTLAESGIFTLVMDDELVLELGARVLGSIGAVYIAADGFKKSIANPGVGNYATMGQALGVGRSLLGDRGLARTYVQAHGTGTPQNRISESHIMSEMAGAFNLEDWRVVAIKAYIGHSLAPAAADQLIASLGVWRDGILPGITTIDTIAEDVHQEHLKFLLAHEEVGPNAMEATFINSKGFGGNNATALILSPERTLKMLTKKHGKAAMQKYRDKAEVRHATSAAYDAATTAGKTKPIYLFNHQVLEGKDLGITRTQLNIPGFKKPINLKMDHPHPDMH